MPDHVAKARQDSDKEARSFNHVYQSGWMAHWTRASCTVKSPTEDHFSCPSGNNEKTVEPEDGYLMIGTEIHKCSKGYKQLEGQSSEVMNGRLRNAEKLKHKSPSVTHSPTGEHSSMPKSDRGFGHFQPFRPRIESIIEKSDGPSLTVSPLPTKSSSKKKQAMSGNSSARQAKSHQLFRDNDLGDFQDGFMGAESCIVPSKFDNGRNKFDSGSMAGHSSILKQEEIKLFTPIGASQECLSNANLAIIKHEINNYDSHSAFLVSENKMGIQRGKNQPLEFGQKNKAPLPNDPSTSHNSSPIFVGKQYHWIQTSPTMELFTGQNCSPEPNRIEMAHFGCHSLQKNPLVDVETMKICTAADSMKGLPGCPPKFSQTIKSFVITQNIDANTCKENKILRDSSIYVHFNEAKFGRHDSFPQFHVQGSLQSKFKPQEISGDNRGKENMKDVRAPKIVLEDESSGETDTMDMDASKKNESAGPKSSSSIKDVTEKGGMPPKSPSTSAGKQVECKPVNVLPDINLELPALPAPVSSPDGEPSNSRTMSLDMEQLQTNGKRPNCSNFNHSSDDSLEQEPSSRWIKRLKLQAFSSFGLGTKSSDLAESSSHDKVNKSKGNISTPEQTFGGFPSKESTVSDQVAPCLRIGELSSVDKTKGQQVTLSHPWIRRWCQKPASPQRNTTATMICEPNCSKVPLEEFQKQFPSIAAMALMGKAMRGFQPCQLQKRDTFVVWNADKSF